MNSLRLVALACLAGAAFAGQAQAQTANLDVTAEVQEQCLVTGGTLDFGDTYNGTADLLGQSSISVTCTSGTEYTVALDNGDNFDVVRRMTDGAAFLNYSLFQPTAAGAGGTRTATAWGEAAAAFGATGTGVAQTINVFGTIPSGQPLDAGTYTDQVLITVAFTPSP